MSSISVQAEFDDLMNAGETAAAALNGEAIEEVTLRLTQWQQRLGTSTHSEEFLLHVRERMARYRDVLGFVTQTMEAMFTSAGSLNAEEPSQLPYGKSGFLRRSAPQPVLMKQVG